MWVDDFTCYEGEAEISIYQGSPERDEFGFEEEDDYSADITRCYRCEEGKAPIEVFPYGKGHDPKLTNDLEKAAIEATWGNTGLPIIFPNEQQEIPLQKAA